MTRYICYIIYKSLYLKFAITCKNLFLSLVVVRLVIFSWISVRKSFPAPTVRTNFGKMLCEFCPLPGVDSHFSWVVIGGNQTSITFITNNFRWNQGIWVLPNWHIASMKHDSWLIFFKNNNFRKNYVYKSIICDEITCFLIL